MRHLNFSFEKPSFSKLLNPLLVGEKVMWKHDHTKFYLLPLAFFIK